jgi:hypothetical protein
VSHDPQRFAAKVRKATAEGPFTVEPTEAGFVLSAEITGPPRARGRRHRERLTHLVTLDPAAGTYLVTDTRETLGEATEKGASLLRLDKRAEAPLDPGVEAHRILAATAAELGWSPARTGPSSGLVVAIIAAVCVVVLVVALLLIR